MFDIWHKIMEEGEAAIPASPSELSALEWCEVGEKYPHLIPEPFRGYEPFNSPFLIREYPFVNEKGDEYLFVATSPDSGKTLKCGLNLRDMLQNLGAEQFANHMLFREIMLAHGFKPLAEEWWRFTLVNEPYPDTYFDFPVHE